VKRYAVDLWLTVRGTVLALLGLAAAYGLSLPLGGLAWWAVGLAGFGTFLATVLAAGVLGFRMDAWDAVEEPAAAIRTVLLLAWGLLLLAIDFLAVLLGTTDTRTA
jgi:hypothetical protein